MFHTWVDNYLEDTVSSEGVGYPVSMSDQNEEHRASPRLGDELMKMDGEDSQGLGDSDDRSFPVDANPSADGCLAYCYSHAGVANEVHYPPEAIDIYPFQQRPSDESGTGGDSDDDSYLVPENPSADRCLAYCYINAMKEDDVNQMQSAVLECPTAGALVRNLEVGTDVFVHKDPSFGIQADHAGTVVDLNIGQCFVTVKWSVSGSLAHVNPEYLVHQDSVMNSPRRSTGSPNRTGRKRRQSIYS
jgi:hypothetical protein